MAVTVATIEASSAACPGTLRGGMAVAGVWQRVWAVGNLRTKLDGLITHIYGLTEEECVHIFSTFPLVPGPVKVAAYNASREVE